jgi:hypothetical protein
MFGVLLRGVAVVLVGMQRMTVGGVGVMSGLLVIAGLGVLRSFAMMLGGVLVMLGGLLVMFVNLVTVHRSLPL